MHYYCMNIGRETFGVTEVGTLLTMFAILALYSLLFGFSIAAWLFYTIATYSREHPFCKLITLKKKVVRSDNMKINEPNTQITLT